MERGNVTPASLSVFKFALEVMNRERSFLKFYPVWYGVHIVVLPCHCAAYTVGIWHWHFCCIGDTYYCAKQLHVVACGNLQICDVFIAISIFLYSVLLLLMRLNVRWRQVEVCVFFVSATGTPLTIAPTGIIICLLSRFGCKRRLPHFITLPSSPIICHRI